ncbi:Taste receptor type 1 member 3 [Manis javanica]|nr:Taste receptor type 1 member 3 [Manis javanica]
MPPGPTPELRAVDGAPPSWFVPTFFSCLCWVEGTRGRPEVRAEGQVMPPITRAQNSWPGMESGREETEPALPKSSTLTPSARESEISVLEHGPPGCYEGTQRVFYHLEPSWRRMDITPAQASCSAVIRLSWAPGIHRLLTYLHVCFLGLTSSLHLTRAWPRISTPKYFLANVLS